jgi:DNA modification methylase
MSAIVHHSECRALMATMAEASVDSIVTDPPYGLSKEPNAAEVLTHWLAGDDYHHSGNGFMGNSWDGFVPGPVTWKEAYRVLKPGGWLLAFFGTRTYDLGTIAIRLAGFEVRDMVEWLYGSGFPKGGNRDGKGTCLKPAHEPIVLARKPLSLSSVAANEARFGTGALNINACRVGSSGARNNGRKAGTNGIYGEFGGTSRVDYRMGRWPANIVHDGSDVVVSSFPCSTSTIGKPRGAASGDGWGMTATGAEYDDSGSAARFFYCAKATQADRDEGLDQFDPQAFVQFQTGNGESGKASSLSEGRETQYRNIHPTVKPEALMRWLCRLVTPPGGLVFDPFTGSGSTGKAAVLEGLSFVGAEMTAEYVPIARARIAAAESRLIVEAEMARSEAAQGSLFGAVA